MPISPNFAPRSSRMPSRPPMNGQQPQPGAAGGSPVDSALAYGRRKMGLPVDFENGHSAPSFEDGGVVPDPSAAPPQPEATDPQSLLKYLSGDGALSPDVIMAMEAMADPDSSMDATGRLDAVLGKAPSPDVAFGVLQHHRTKYNGYTAAARVAAEKGDFAKAAAYANKAHESVPGSRKRFAPAPGGVAMLGNSGQSQTPEPQEEAYGGGGSVDSSNPNDDTSEMDDADGDASYANGGEVDTRYDDFPDSDGNIEDRRHEHGEGWVGKSDGPDPDSGSINGSSIPDLNRWNERQAKEGERKEFERNSGVVRKQSFADGGPVEEDNTYGDFPPQEDTAAVTNDADTDDAGAAVSPTVGDDDMTTGGVPEPVNTADPLGGGGYRMLSPEDLNRTMSLGFDSAVENARKNTISPKDISDAVNWAGGKLWEGAKAIGGAAVDPRNWPTAPLGPGWSSPTSAPSRGVPPTDQAEHEAYGDVTPQRPGERQSVNPGEEDEARMSGYDPVTRQTGAVTPPAAGGATPDQGPADPDAGYKKDRQHANERRDEMMKWYEDQSRKLFPWASQEPQRQAFIMHGMERFFGQDLSRENNIRADKAGVAERGIQAKRLNDAETRRIREESNIRNNETKKQLAAFNQTEMGKRFDRGQEASTLRAAINAGADVSDPKVTEQYRKALEQSTGIKVPQDGDTMREILGLGKSIVKPQGQQGGGAPQNAPLDQLWVDPNGVLRRKTAKGWEKA